MKGWVLIGAHGGLGGATESRLPLAVCACVQAVDIEMVRHLKTILFTTLK